MKNVLSLVMLLATMSVGAPAVADSGVQPSGTAEGLLDARSDVVFGVMSHLIMAAADAEEQVDAETDDADRKTVKHDHSVKKGVSGPRQELSDSEGTAADSGAKKLHDHDAKHK